MSLTVDAFKNPYRPSPLKKELPESSSADKDVWVNMTEKRKRKFAPDQNRTVKSVQFNMTKKVVSEIKCPEMKSFIEDLISNLTPEKHSSQITKLNIIQKALLETKTINVALLTLTIVNKKNPIIKTLRSLDSPTIDNLKQINVPIFFQNFFEELEYYAKIAEAKRCPMPEKSIEILIFYSEDLLDIGKKTKALKILNLAIEAVGYHQLPPSAKVALYRNIAFILCKAKDKEYAIQLLVKASKFISNYTSRSEQLKAFQDLAQDFAEADARDQIIQILDIILQTALFPSDNKIVALREIFLYLFKLENIEQMLEIIDRSKGALEKDIVLAETCELLLEDPAKPQQAFKIVGYIQDDSIRNRMCNKVSKQLPDISLKALEIEEPSMR